MKLFKNWIENQRRKKDFAKIVKGFYKCKENDNYIEVSIEDGRLDEFIFYDCLKSGLVIGANDLRIALSEKGFDIVPKQKKEYYGKRETGQSGTR